MVWSLASLVFGTIYSGLLAALDFAQAVVVLAALRGGNGSGLDQYAFNRP